MNKDGTFSTQMNMRRRLASAAKNVVPVSPEQMNVGQRLTSAAWYTGIENENGTKANRPSNASTLVQCFRSNKETRIVGG